MNSPTTSNCLHKEICVLHIHFTMYIYIFYLSFQTTAPSTFPPSKKRNYFWRVADSMFVWSLPFFIFSHYCQKEKRKDPFICRQLCFHIMACVRLSRSIYNFRDPTSLGRIHVFVFIVLLKCSAGHLSHPSSDSSLEFSWNSFFDFSFIIRFSSILFFDSLLSFSSLLSVE